MTIKQIIEILAIITAFGIIVTASNHLAKIFQKIKLPLITGFIIIGILVGPYLLKMLPGDLSHLGFVNDFALAFIALASGAEIYIKEIRDKMRAISFMSAAQFFVIFILSFVLVFFLSNLIPFMKGVDLNVKIAIAILISTIFIASSPASAIAIVHELRAKGEFTKVALGVTIIKDIFVIILFAATFGISNVLVSGAKFDSIEIIIVFVEVILSIGLGFFYGKLLQWNFKIIKNEYLDITIILLLGGSMFYLSHLGLAFSERYLGKGIHLEALLIGIVASFYLINYTKHRQRFQKLIEHFGHYVYAAFFTLIGATLSLDVLLDYWAIAFLLFGIRILAVFIASIVGSVILKDSVKNTFLSWTPYITQAGVSLGLITIIAAHFTDFGVQFEAILIAVIILNQFLGPPLMKWAIVNVGEAHVKSDKYEYDFKKDVYIFGLGGKAIMLAKTLKREGYGVKIISDRKNVDTSSCTDVKIYNVEKIDFETLEATNFKSADAAVILRKEEEAFKINELIFEKYGTPNVIVVSESPSSVEKFKELGSVVVAPTAAMIALLADYVRSPEAAEILLGLQENREAEDIEVLAKDVHNRVLRDLQMPLGVLVLLLVRNHEKILPHGYTQIRLHDIVTVVGSHEQLEIVRTKLQY